VGIRVKCDIEGAEKCWIEYRDNPWRFGDRRRIIEASSDSESLGVILEYAENWHLIDVDGNKIPYDPDADISIFDNIDDGPMLSWIIGSWFEARSRRSEVPNEN